MNPHIVEGSWWNEHGSKLFKCSACNSSIACNAVQPHYFQFCWNCGVKFGPEPKAEPTVGEWLYSTDTKNVYSTSLGVIASVHTEKAADGHLMAASKKLLASLKRYYSLRRTSFGADSGMIDEAKAAIAEAEGK